MTDDLEPLLDTDGVAALLNIHRHTVLLMTRKKELPALKVGGQWRFRPAELRLWLDDQARLAAR